MRYTKKEKWMAVALLAVPLTLTVTLMFPHYERFTAPGHIEAISELGIDGHVYMTYVEGGVTKNYLEKLLVSFRYDSQAVSFEPASREEAIDTEETRDEGEVYKKAVIANALDVSGYAAEPSPKIESKYADILEKSADYVGDSFGLMVAIGLVEEESRQDFSRGGRYTIAGTGKGHVVRGYEQALRSIAASPGLFPCRNGGKRL